ncbi:hypothetical protein [Pseudoduganella namucuonensis]|uniref:Type 4a pilus biogenesis protein PilO n=1 Tax=Pseudoduganella namucuonensis TaxID=1035707 RepID=A0A1I7JWV6_9BURK|nr:hypothetical protein [Pseudoduganella namucuonensis]SFU89555.1 hypothetical protein SAMN05216552_1013108 [Pseudoduganella namucuonensis]
MASMTSRAALRLPSNLGQRTGWEAKRLWSKLGPGAALGIALLAAALALRWHASTLEQRHQPLQRQLAAAANAAMQPVPKVPTAADGLAAFYNYLPAHSAIPDQLQTLVETARKHNVPLAKAEYKAQPEPRAGFLRYQITLPLKADYASTQAFLLDAMQAMPTLTLDSVAFKRDRVDTGEVDARIQFILLVRKAEVAR